MEFPNDDLVQIMQRKVVFVQKFGGLDITSDIEYLVTELERLRRKERDYGFIDEDTKNIVNAYRHLSTKDHKWIPDSCANCAHAKRIMEAIKAGEM